MSLNSLLSHWRSDPEFANNFVEWQVRPARMAELTPFPEGMHPSLINALEEVGIQKLYLHQLAAWNYIKSGANIVVTTGTASGKSLCYNLSVIDGLLRDANAYALYLFPTKALTQDQLTGLDQLATLVNREIPRDVSIKVDIYDGDTPSNKRTSIRSSSRIVLSNPDMLHAGILPHHTIWAKFLSGLRYVVIDEMHVYRGIFGSHVANVLRRLKRIAGFYGTSLQYILTSATIGNSLELASKLTGSPVLTIDEDYSERGPRHFIIYNPPFVHQDLGIRQSVVQECVHISKDLLYKGVQTIVFGRTRRTVELILTLLREQIQISNGVKSRMEPVDLVRGYRSGYLPSERRQIEAGLRKGDVRVVVATNALELGIDLGQMGASVLAGYPGTIAATWQQAGRAGRGREPAVAIFIASADPLDQFLARYPEYFFSRSPEHGLINPDNLLILLSHLRCAAFELPFKEGERYGSLTGEEMHEYLDYLQQEGCLHQSGNKYFWIADQYPAQGISLRSASSERIRLLIDSEIGSRGKVIGEVDRESAPWMVHPGAIYLHEAQVYYVRSLDLQQGLAVLLPTEVDYYTQAQSDRSFELLQIFDKKNVSGGEKAYGEIKVTTQVKGYRKIQWHTAENLGQSELEMPASELVTTGYWIALSDVAVEELRSIGMWSNAPNNYGQGWTQIRQQVRERDRFQCQACGLLEGSREHDVHHKVPFRAFSTVEEANQLTNLVTLCPICHRRAETAVRVRSGMAGLSFVFGHLAPLFLMCDTRDLGGGSDPTSPLADGQPAVVLFDLIPAGIGLSQRLFDVHEQLVSDAYRLVQSCGCTDGCPSCVGPGGESGYGGKEETLSLLKILSGNI